MKTPGLLLIILQSDQCQTYFDFFVIIKYTSIGAIANEIPVT